MHVGEMRILRWMCGHTSSDKIRNKDIRDKIDMASVVDKMRKRDWDDFDKVHLRLLFMELWYFAIT
ncbi:hypothetical protein H5410_018264 [Solanum commersonii]|uniref:Uncharacterized protein n=1 Tax=Solanum commersonii TaxID=4109 RepID=A0A9J6A1W3_SOLCO|nr:hypothetical protein H5410_018264 [Solanum commersonii]